MKTPRLACFSFSILAFLAACATAENPDTIGGDAHVRVDTGTGDVSVGIDTQTPGTDSGARDSNAPGFDTALPPDTGTDPDTGVVDFDTGTDPDTGVVDFDTGVPTGSPCIFCTEGTCPTAFSDEGCYLGCVGFGGASDCKYDESASTVCTCIP